MYDGIRNPGDAHIYFRRNLNLKRKEHYYLIGMGRTNRVYILEELCALSQPIPMDVLYKRRKMQPKFVVIGRYASVLEPHKHDEFILSQLRDEFEPKIPIADLLLFDSSDYFSFREENIIEGKYFSYKQLS